MYMYIYIYIELVDGGCTPTSITGGPPRPAGYTRKPHKKPSRTVAAGVKMSPRCEAQRGMLM